MSTIRTFEEILAWQEAEKMCLVVYREFRQCKDFAFRDQIQRASVSVMNNIAEGYERNGNKEFRNFLFIAKGSAAEVRSMISIAEKLGYLSNESAHELSAQSLKIGKMLSGLIKAIS